MQRKYAVVTLTCLLIACSSVAAQITSTNSISLQAALSGVPVTIAAALPNAIMHESRAHGAIASGSRLQPHQSCLRKHEPLRTRAPGSDRAAALETRAKPSG